MTISITELKTPQIVALFNEHVAKPVKKFADRATAEKRLAAMMAEKNLQLAFNENVGHFLADAASSTEDTETEAPAPKAKKAKGGRRGPDPEYADDAKIKVLVKSNPKKEGTASYFRFELYNEVSTVGAAIAAGITRADLRWDVAHNHISIK